MNQDETKLEQQLRDATGAPGFDAAQRGFEPRAGGRKPPDNVSRASDAAPSDADAAALAEGWQALGQLLQAANADFRPELVIKQLRGRLLRERMWRGGALLAAAVLLIGVGIAWYASRGGAGDVPQGSPHGDSVVVHPVEKSVIGDNLPPANKTDQAKVAPTTVAPTSVAQSTGNDSSPSSSSGWDQTLDQEITQADEGVRSVNTLNSSDDSIDQLDLQLVSFSKEVAADSL